MGRARIFREGAQHAEAEPHAAAIDAHLGAGQDAEALRIALEGGEFLPVRRRQFARNAARRLEALREPASDRRLARMAERRIADVVRQTGRLHDARYAVARRRVHLARVHQPLPDQHAERAPDIGHFDGMDQPVMHMVVVVERMHLRLVGQPPERRREGDAVDIDHMGGPPRLLLIVRRRQPRRLQQLAPVHIALPYRP